MFADPLTLLQKRSDEAQTTGKYTSVAPKVRGRQPSPIDNASNLLHTRTKIHLVQGGNFQTPRMAQKCCPEVCPFWESLRGQIVWGNFPFRPRFRHISECFLFSLLFREKQSKQVNFCSHFQHGEIREKACISSPYLSIGNAVEIPSFPRVICTGIGYLLLLFL